MTDRSKLKKVAGRRMAAPLRNLHAAVRAGLWAGLPSAAAKVYVVLLMLLPPGHRRHLSAGLIGQHAGVARTTVSRAVRELESVGLLKVERMGPGIRNRYEAMPPRVGRLACAKPLQPLGSRRRCDLDKGHDGPCKGEGEL